MPPRKRPNRQQPAGKGRPAQRKRPAGAKAVAGQRKQRPAGRKRASSSQASSSKVASKGNITARTRKKKSWKDSEFRRSVFTALAALLAVAIIVPLIAFFTAYSVTKVPEPEELVNNQVSYIMASDQNTELARIVPPEGNRQNVKLDEIPEPVRNAVLSAEDRNFYENPGFSVTGFARAAIGQVLGRSGAGGGSTITQQYVKNALVGDEFSLTRKAKELVISAKMAREWSKDEILEAYLNTIYFGRNAYGISAAAQAYFSKDVSKLTPEEGAVLAATIQAPSALDPWTNRQKAEGRWNYVLDGMVDIGAMDRTARMNAKYPEVKDPATTQNTSIAQGPNGLIKSRVISELEAAGITEEQVNTGGLRIVTTIDNETQKAAVEEYHAQREGLHDGVRGAVASVDPRNGGIRAWYGGDDPVGFDYAGAGLQTGSTFKIVALAAYLDQGGSIYDMFDSSPVTTGETEVNNVDNQSCGTCSIAQALKMSLNTSFIRLTRELNGGAQDVADMAHRLGAAETLPGIGKTLREGDGPPFEGITLGQYQSSPLDMASILATLSNGGKYHRPHFVERVETLDGEVLMDNSSMQSDQVIEPDVANNVISAMGPIAAYSNGNSLANGRPSAAKTGTSQLGDTGMNKDAWMIGSTPQLATAVWMGTTNRDPLTNQWGGTMYGSGSPSTIWKNVMDRSLANEEIQEFAVPEASTGSGTVSGGGYEQAPAEPAPAEEPAAPEAPPAEAPSSPPAAPAPPRPAPGGPPPARNDDLGEILDGILRP